LKDATSSSTLAARLEILIDSSPMPLR